MTELSLYLRHCDKYIEQFTPVAPVYGSQSPGYVYVIFLALAIVSLQRVKKEEVPDRMINIVDGYEF